LDASDEQTLLLALNVGRRRVLVTGASGMCGAAIIEALDAEPTDFEVVSTSRRPLRRESHLLHDLREPFQPGELERIDALVHCAAEVDERSEGFGVVDENLRLAYHAVEGALNAGARTIVLLSSVAVYGTPPSRMVVSEETPLQPTTPYGVAKVLSERLVESLGASARVVSLRLGYVLGPRAPDRYFVMRLARSVGSGERVSLRNGDATRLSFIDARDVAAACISALRGAAQGPYNLVSGVQPTVRETLHEIASALGVGLPQVIELDDREAAFATVFPNRRAVDDLGIGFRTFKETIAATVVSGSDWATG
jgi:UDP-glucose 4-epimerase